MTHAAVLVNVGALEELPDKAYLEGPSELTDLLEPYDENTEVPRYRDYLTRERKASEIMATSKAWEGREAKLDVRFTKPIRPRDRFTEHPSQISDEAWQSAVADYTAEVQAIADLYTDQEVADAYNAYWTREDTGGDRLYVANDEPGGETRIYRWSTYNPQSKWDYWQVIDDALTLKDGTTATAARVRDIDLAAMFEKQHLPTFALVDEQRGWTERGHLGWWGTSWDHKPDFDQGYREIVATWNDDDVIVMCDYHI